MSSARMVGESLSLSDTVSRSASDGENAQPLCFSAQKNAIVFINTSLWASSCGTSERGDAERESSFRLVNQCEEGSNERNEQNLRPLPATWMRCGP